MWTIPTISDFGISPMYQNTCGGGSGQHNTCHNGSGQMNGCGPGSSGGGETPPIEEKY